MSERERDHEREDEKRLSPEMVEDLTIAEVLRSLEARDAAADVTVLTMTVAALLPVLQAMMSFTQTNAQAGRTTALALANVDAASLSILAESVDRILRKPEPRVVWNEQPPPPPQPEPLAVS